MLTHRARCAHLHLEFSPDHKIMEPLSGLGWEGPQNPSHSTACHGQDTSHHSRWPRETMSLHTFHILWDEDIRGTLPGARTPLNSPGMPSPGSCMQALRAHPQHPCSTPTAATSIPYGSGGREHPQAPAWACQASAHPRECQLGILACPSRAPATLLTLAQALPRPCTQGWAPMMSLSTGGAGRRRAGLCWLW